MLHGIHMNLVGLVCFLFTEEEDGFRHEMRLERFVQRHYGSGLEKDKTRSWEILCVAIAIIQVKEN